MPKPKFEIILDLLPHLFSIQFSWPICFSLITSRVLLTAIKFLALLGFEPQVLRGEAQKQMSWQKQTKVYISSKDKKVGKTLWNV